MGAGEGDYQRAGAETNGVVYEYAGPGDGAYAPVQPLPAPTRQRLVDLTGSVEPVAGVEVFGEWAGSLNDQNRFSGRDVGDDRGRAYTAGVRVAPTTMEVGGTTLGTVSGRVRRRERGQNFVTFDQTRPIEYGRRWNLSRGGSGLPGRLLDRGDETVDEGQVTVDWGNGSSLEAGGGRLTVGSVRFLEVRPGLSYANGPVEASASLERRTEQGVVDGSFRDASRTWTAQTELALDPQAPYRVSVQGGLRRRDVTDVFRRTEQRRETESVLMRIDGRARPLDRAVDARLFYDAATERTPIQREVYVQTSPERGQYVWRDANDDGVQQVDEFVPETTPNEGTYVQRFVPSDTLESVVDLQLRTRLALRPRRLWPDGDAWWKKGLRRVTAETRVQVREQSRTDNPTALYRLDPDEFRRPGRTTDGSLRLEQRLEVFRTQWGYGLDASWRQVRGLTERAAGGERRFLNRWEVEGRLRPASSWQLRATGTAERDRVQSEAFDEARSFDIRTLRIRPSVSYQPRPALDVTLAGGYARKRDRAKGRRVDLYTLPLELTWRRAGRLRLTANAEVARVDLNGTAVGRAQFELTDGRGPGTSLLWGLQGQYAFTDRLRATLNYDGRAPATTDPIHTVRVQVNASF